MDCLFCKIVNKEISADIVYENEKILSFKDINPQAPIHFLVIPKEHIFNIDDLSSASDKIMPYIFDVIYKLAKNYNLDKSGFRIISNYGEDAGQTVNHLHFHILGGKCFNQILC